ncbi:SGNH/GDSL hydrolase family protein [Planctomicrobium sp. SH661]|uniref:SGNH/GDSL hydrolase family protein n=1 Tax=Planctomicrobium sp. SH661 TaxID=3448124 RepID=UPI003F5BD87D
MRTQLLHHFVSGNAFFSGAACFLIAGLLKQCGRSGASRFSFLFVLLGTILIFLSATPLPVPASVGLAIVTLAWFALTRTSIPQVSQAEAEVPGKRRRLPSLFDVTYYGSWILAAGWELSWHQLPAPSTSAPQRLVVIADSITAGVGDETVPWPGLLAQEHGVEVVDFSRMGATVSSARDRIRQQPVPPGIVLIELGGNDVLGTTSVAEFQSELEGLIQDIAGADREIYLFELPLPPLGNRFGQVQRNLAGKYGVKLIPKSVLADVILSEATTSDSIHLTQQGQDQLARAVWRIISPSP